jgi:cytidylate kinase
MSQPFVITIDGYVATGKGTTAVGVAQELWFRYLDTGAMYRAVTLYIKRKGMLEASDHAKAELMDEIQLTFLRNPVTGHDDMYMDGENIEADIRATELALDLHYIVPVQPVRERLVELQRAFVHSWNIIIDGRDAGTVIFPQAQLKVFLIGDRATRIQRRYDQLVRKWLTADLDAVSLEVDRRDHTDYLWPDAVNKPAEDACFLDTTHTTIPEQIATVVGRARERMPA